jgi:hypothetical protein
MDGTLADLYGVENWLDNLIAENVKPYAEAKPMLNLSALARKLNNLQKQGNEIVIISWLSKCGSPEYDAKVTAAKKAWLFKHLHSVHFNEIHVVPYGFAKETFAHGVDDILFDDEEKNRINWTGKAHDVNNILEVLREI